MKAALLKAYRINYIFTSIDKGNKLIFYLLTIIEYAHMLIITLLISTNDTVPIQSSTFSLLSNSMLFYINVAVLLPTKLMFAIAWITAFILSYRSKQLPKSYSKALLYGFYLWQTIFTLIDMLIVVSYIFRSVSDSYSIISSMAMAVSTLMVFIIITIQTLFYSVEVNFERRWMKNIVIYVIGFIAKLVICIHPKIMDYSIYANSVAIAINLVAIVYITRFYAAKFVIYLPFHVAMLIPSVLRISNIDVRALTR